ncbi:MAG: AAA family ATPase [Anaerolineae bacterium]|nr:AAA family ATPase [Anaerolineae bacterium]
MKIAVTGKGGVGKTTLTALLAQHYADQGRHVLAVDADPSPCLALALGFQRGAAGAACAHRRDGRPDLRADRRAAG